jgi:hypothetical protein
MPTILAFLQNQWFRDPDGVRRIYERHPEARNDLIKRFLFMGCLTGRRLQAAFGVDFCSKIVWEEASPEVGGHSSSAFKADHHHIRTAIVRHMPPEDDLHYVVLAFGKIAGDAVETVMDNLGCEKGPTIRTYYGPHPAARQNPMPALKSMAERLKKEFPCQNV